MAKRPKPVPAAEQERQSRATWVKRSRADLAKRVRRCDDYVTLKQVERAILRGIARSVTRYFKEKDQA